MLLHYKKGYSPSHSEVTLLYNFDLESMVAPAKDIAHFVPSN
jgi:hypothetical protein